MSVGVIIEDKDNVDAHIVAKESMLNGSNFQSRHSSKQLFKFPILVCLCENICLIKELKLIDELFSIDDCSISLNKPKAFLLKSILLHLRVKTLVASA